ncbi:MAG TPA: hypothetical protein VFC57_09535, partial [Aeromicrobium sp.]|nr:hypothetical protein [Aeromicrobium sp.]
VSAEAVFSKSLPKVAVPQLDQHAWNGSPEVARIATAIFDRSMTQRGAVLRQAVAWFEELAPPQTMPNDGPYVAIAGPAELLKFLLALQDNYPSAADGKHELIERLESFVEAQKAGRSFSEGDEASGYPEWASRSRKLLSALTSQLNGMSS